MNEFNYYKSQLEKLGDCAWPDVTLKIKGLYTQTKNLTLTVELAQEILDWCEKNNLKQTKKEN